MSPTASSNKINSRDVHSQFIFMNSDKLLYQFYEKNFKRVFIVHLKCFKVYKAEPLPSFESLLDVISLQHEWKLVYNIYKTSKEGFIQAYMDEKVLNVFEKTSRLHKYPRLSLSFKEALQVNKRHII